MNGYVNMNETYNNLCETLLIYSNTDSDNPGGKIFFVVSEAAYRFLFSTAFGRVSSAVSFCGSIATFYWLF
jgi:hypothetical protein